MKLQVAHFTRLTCHCGNTIEVPSKPGWDETESLGTPYSTIDWKMPDGWSYGDCPVCRVLEEEAP